MPPCADALTSLLSSGCLAANDGVMGPEAGVQPDLTVVSLAGRANYVRQKKKGRNGRWLARKAEWTKIYTTRDVWRRAACFLYRDNGRLATACRTKTTTCLRSCMSRYDGEGITRQMPLNTLSAWEPLPTLGGQSCVMAFDSRYFWVSCTVRMVQEANFETWIFVC
jgi:hypothetical protein